MADTPLPKGGAQSQFFGPRESISLPEPKPETGGPRKCFYWQSLQYIAQQSDKNKALTAFRQLLTERNQWSAEQIHEFLKSRMDQVPPLIRAVADNRICGFDQKLSSLSLRAPDEATYKDYGGFWYDELGPWRIAFADWREELDNKREAQTNAKRAKNLPANKESKRKPPHWKKTA